MPMEYRFVYRAYSHTRLMGAQGAMRDQEEYLGRSVSQSNTESQDWSNILNEFANDGYTVKNSGAFPLADNVVFWALLERP
jgi:hypothetical protein